MEQRKSTPMYLPPVRIITTMFILAFAAPCLCGHAASYLVMTKKPDSNQDKLAKLNGRLTGLVREIGLIKVDSDDPRFAAAAMSISSVESVLPNLRFRWPTDGQGRFQAGNPPFSGDDDFLFDLQWAMDAIDAPEAWAAGARGAGVRVAVLDSGVDVDHFDLAPNLNLGLSTWFDPAEPFVDDLLFHGSHVCGIIAAADNGFGVIGVAPEAELVMVKVGTAAGPSVGAILAGIVYSANIGADIANMSFGLTLNRRGGSEQGVPYTAAEAAGLINAFTRVTQYAHSRGVTLFAAAGNESNDGDHDADLVTLPADSPHVISVASTGPLAWGENPAADLDVPSLFTNHGQSAIDIAAPGGGINDEALYLPPDQWSICSVAGTIAPCWVYNLVISCDAAGGWVWTAGTSMASPHAAGVAALILGAQGHARNPNQVRSILEHSADDLGKPGNDDFYGAGRVNAANAVSRR